MSKWLKIGAILRKKDLGKDGSEQFYMKISSGKSKDGRTDFEEIVLKNGQNLQLQRPEAEVRALFERGFIDEDEMERRIEKLPDFVMFNIVLPPDQN